MLLNELVLIFVGVGSGKICVLIMCIVWLIQQGYVLLFIVFVVIFMNKVVCEMMVCLLVMMLIDMCGMWIGMFYGLCNWMLCMYWCDVGLLQIFQIFDMVDQLFVIKWLMKVVNVDDEKYLLKNVQYFINNVKEQGLCLDKVDVIDNFNCKFVELYQVYDQQCQCEGVVDFFELLLCCYELFVYNVLLCVYYQVCFWYIFVDEFQDINKLQYVWFKMFVGGENVIFVVGDDDQLIYVFCGVNVGNMCDFEDEFCVCNLIKFEQNYWLYGNIFDVVNQLILNNVYCFGKNLCIDVGYGELVCVYEVSMDLQEVGWIVEEICLLINIGMVCSEVVVLYCSNVQLCLIEYMLMLLGILYCVYGGLCFFEWQEVKYVFVYLCLIDNLNDDMVFVCVVNFLMCGIGVCLIE